MSGELDARTPPENADEVRIGFPNSTHVIVKRMGHNTTGLLLGTHRIGELIGEFLEGRMPQPTMVSAPPIAFVLK